MNRFAPLLAALLCSTAVQAQDIIGFDISSFGDIVLKRDQFGGDIKFEAAFGDYNNEPISAYSAKSVFATIGRSVGRLDVATDVQVFPCTAFLVEEDLVMTNHHCVPGILDHPRAGASAIIGVRFIAGYINEGVTDGTRSFLVNPVPVETNKDLDYTLLRIIGEKPGRDFGVLRLAARMPEANDPYWIIGHPMGEAQRISREKCRANAPAMSEGRLLHTCDTMPGNSGSPVIDATSQQVIGLHNAGSDRNKINYGIPMSRILQSSKILAAAPGPVDPVPPKADRETLADRALAETFALPDDAQIEAGLVKLTKDFAGTSAARTAQRRLDHFERQRREAQQRMRDAKKRKSADEANAALLAAIVITDIETKRATLKSLIERYPGTPVVVPARAMLASMKEPDPIVRKPRADANQHFIGYGEMLPEGTTVTVRSESVYSSPSSSAAAVSVVHGDIVLGRHVGSGWYNMVDRNGQYVRIAEGTKVTATAAPVPVPTKQKPAVTAAPVHAEGTSFKIRSATLHFAPSSTSKTASYAYGTVTIGAHVKNNWYAVEGKPGRYVQITENAEVMQTAATKTPTTATTDKVAKRGAVLAPGTTLKIKSLQAHSAPSSSSRTLSYIYGTVTVGSHVRDNWYGVEGKVGRYVKIPIGAEIVSATSAVKLSRPTVTSHDGGFAPGTTLRIKSLQAHSAPRSNSRTVSYVYGTVTVGTHVRDDWYEVYQKFPKRYVQLPDDAKPASVRLTAPDAPLRPGTKLTLRKSLPLYKAPTSGSATRKTIIGPVTIGQSIGDNWYSVRGESGYLKLTPENIAASQ